MVNTPALGPNKVVAFKTNSNSRILIGRIGPVGLVAKSCATENLNVTSLSKKYKF